MLKRSSRACTEALKKLDKITEQKKIETTMYEILEVELKTSQSEKEQKVELVKMLEKSRDNVMLTHCGHP